MNKIELHDVCEDCLSIGITDINCVCTYDRNHKTIKLEFERCGCCGNILNNGMPAKTEYNKKILSNK